MDLVLLNNSSDAILLLINQIFLLNYDYIPRLSAGHSWVQEGVFLNLTVPWVHYSVPISPSAPSGYPFFELGHLQNH